ncbi:MAG TPA: acyl-CoA dehydrogenase family protein [Acidimicrobiales bacterium]|nr:acyl-CoA dehydrogenase family protein [Acidimicrobiales bacterium]
MTGTRELDAVRDEVAAWLDAHWDPEITVRRWWEVLALSGWGFPTWPTEWCGRGLGSDALSVVSDEFSARGALGAPAGLGQMMGGPVVMQHGDDDQRVRFVRRLAAGLEGWCQFFSEPGSGSDLAGAQTRAERDGDEWVVNGQKVWTSGAMTADRGMLLARVDMDAPKHKGLGYFIIEVDQPGIEIRPLKQMTGNAHFNEVFFTDARVSHADLIGRPGDGWAAAVTTLAYERGGRAGTVGASNAPGGSRQGILDRKAGDVVTSAAVATPRAGNYGPPPGTSPTELLRGLGKQKDAMLRQQAVRHYTLSRIAALNQERVRAEAAAGKSPGPASSTTKLFRSNMVRANRDLGPQILGPAGMLAGADAPYDGAVTRATLQAPSVSIAGGTDEIQHNIIGERVLGLPREPEVDRNTPFRQLKVGTQR